MSKTFTFTLSTINAALDAAAAYGKNIDLLRVEALNGQLSNDAVKAALMAPIAKYYDVKLVDKTRGEGKTWDKDAAKYAAAVKAHQRMAADISGKVKASNEQEIPADVLKAALALKKICETYEGSARGLASGGVAAVFAKAE